MVNRNYQFAPAHVQNNKTPQPENDEYCAGAVIPRVPRIFPGTPLARMGTVVLPVGGPCATARCHTTPLSYDTSRLTLTSRPNQFICIVPVRCSVEYGRAFRLSRKNDVPVGSVERNAATVSGEIRRPTYAPATCASRRIRSLKRKTAAGWRRTRNLQQELKVCDDAPTAVNGSAGRHAPSAY